MTTTLHSARVLKDVMVGSERVTGTRRSARTSTASTASPPTHSAPATRWTDTLATASSWSRADAECPTKVGGTSAPAASTSRTRETTGPAATTRREATASTTATSTTSSWARAWGRATNAPCTWAVSTSGTGRPDRSDAVSW